MGGISDDAIRRRAYQIWEREGRPHGRQFEHWVQAQVELLAQAGGNGGGRAPAARGRAAASKAKPAVARKAAAPPAPVGRGRKPA